MIARPSKLDRCQCPGPTHTLDVNGDCKKCGKYYIYETWLDTLDATVADLEALRDELDS